MKKPSKGKNLENAVCRTNMVYRKNKQAFIVFQGTPVNITNSGAMLNKGSPDYVGILNGGQYLVFDAKECGSKTSFPLSNIKDHQYEFVKLADEMGGLAFFLIHFYKMDKLYKVPLSFVKIYWEQWSSGGRASIPIKDFEDKWLVCIQDYLELKPKN